MRQPIRLVVSGTRKVHEAVVMLSADKVNGFCDFVRQITGWSVAGSNNSRLTRPLIVAFELLITCVLTDTSSPWRMKRGRFGNTINGLLLMTSLVSMPYFMSSVLASAWNFQVVLLSGNVNCTMTSPSSFVSNDG